MTDHCVAGCDGVPAANLGWFKISEYGWDGQQWGSDLIHRSYKWTFDVPTGLAAGYVNASFIDTAPSSVT